jgi:ribonuclease-3
VGLFDFLKRNTAASPQNAVQELAEAFYLKLGYLFRDPSFLLQALTHRSHSRTVDNSADSNERLEYLGDSILGMVISEYLYHTYPDYKEGDLTKTKALLVNEGALSMVGKESGLNMLILLSAEEEKSGGRNRNSIISDALEAVIGAIYLDSGLNAARDFIHRVILSRKEDILSDANQHNYKGELLEYLQARGGVAPHYEVLAEEGPDHEKIFRIAVHTGGKITGTGIGQSKKEAEQRAAAESLNYLKRNENG